MNKKDFILVLTIILISIFLFLMLNKKPKYAYVYYENKVINIINMSKNDTYEVEGYNGKVIIEVLDNKIKVKSETSNKNICSNMGFVSSSAEPIICLPNKIVIKVIDNIDLDGVIR